MKRQTFPISLLASLAVLAPRAGLGAISVAYTENLGVIDQTGELAVESFQLAQAQDQDSEVLHQIAIALAQVGQFERALDVFQTISDRRLKAGALYAIAATLVETGEFDRAVTIAQTQIDSLFKTQALNGMTGSLLK